MSVEQFNQQKRSLAQAFRGAVDAGKPGHSKQPAAIKWLIPVLLICTMLPIDAAAVFLSLTAAITIMITIAAAWQKIIILNKSTTQIIAGLAIVSILSGCGPVLFGTPNDLSFFDLGHHPDVKTYTVQKVGVFGFGLEGATVETAMKEADIKNVIAMQTVRGYGLISMSRITIAGK
ncbi:hypothetical protein [Geopsychrobacter electrodiphilus]|uniref:hypothetical protein n=1 Tax=Geopsychrobacter electrodiphilus TaxID=225196 RepID=UPI00036D2D07|nr:hypothetical protein [Geopsychrobacter electrodiphilus]